MAVQTFGVSVFQPVAQPIGNAGARATRRVALLATFPQGPAAWTKVDASNAGPLMGGTNNVLGYTGPAALGALIGQASVNTVYDLEILVRRSHVGSAIVNLVDGSAHPTIRLTGVNVYAGSKGNNLSVATTAPQIVASRLQTGNGAVNEIQQIVFYGVTGATGNFTLQGRDSAGNTFTTNPIAYSGTPATLVANINTQINATNVAGTGGYGAGGVTVASAVPNFAIPDAVAVNITYSGTSYHNATWQLLTSPSTLSGGSGVIPLQTIVITDTALGAVQQTFTFGPNADLSSLAGIVSAITARNIPNSTTAIVSAINVASGAFFPTTQTSTQFVGGTDGLGGTLANDSNATIAAALNDLATGNYGQVDFVVPCYDGNSALQALCTAADAVGRTNNVFSKYMLGPASGTAKSVLTSTYQTANSSSVCIVGVASMPGSIAGVPGTLQGFAVGAAVAGLKARCSAEINLYRQPISGVANISPTDDATGAVFTPTDLQNLANAGLTPIRYDARLNRVVIDRLITTGSQLDVNGNPNGFLYLSVRDAWDRMATELVDVLFPFIGQPSSSVGVVVSSVVAAANTYLASVKGRYHNGATAAGTFDPISNIITVNVVEGPRIPIAQIYLNLAAQTGLSN